MSGDEWHDGKYTIDPDDPEAGTPEEALHWLLNRADQRRNGRDR